MTFAAVTLPSPDCTAAPSLTSWRTEWNLCRSVTFLPYILKFRYLLFRPQQRWRSIIRSTSLCLCVCVCLSDSPRAYLRTTCAIFTNFCAYRRGSVLLLRSDAIPRGRDNFGGFSSPLKMHCLALLRYEFRYEGRFFLNLLLNRKVGQNSISCY